MVKAKVFVLARHFDGLPTPENFKLIEEELPELKQDRMKHLYNFINYNVVYIFY